MPHTDQTLQLDDPFDAVLIDQARQREASAGVAEVQAALDAAFAPGLSQLRELSAHAEKAYGRFVSQDRNHPK